MSTVRTIPCPPATARVGWTVYEPDGSVVGWVRRASDYEYDSRMPADTFWAIPRFGAVAPRAHRSPSSAARSLRA